MTPIVWPLRSYNPRNMIGKRALQDIYAWADRGELNYDIVYGKQNDEDMIVVRTGYILDFKFESPPWWVRAWRKLLSWAS
jgi:hypothetical protein